MDNRCYVCGHAGRLQKNEVVFRNMFTNEPQKCHPRTCKRHHPITREGYAWHRLRKSMDTMLKTRSVAEVTKLIIRARFIHKDHRKQLLRALQGYDVSQYELSLLASADAPGRQHMASKPMGPAPKCTVCDKPSHSLKPFHCTGHEWCQPCHSACHSCLPVLTRCKVDAECENRALPIDDLMPDTAFESLLH